MGWQVNHCGRYKHIQTLSRGRRAVGAHLTCILGLAWSERARPCQPFLTGKRPGRWEEQARCFPQWDTGTTDPLSHSPKPISQPAYVGDRKHSGERHPFRNFSDYISTPFGRALNKKPPRCSCFLCTQSPGTSLIQCSPFRYEGHFCNFPRRGDNKRFWQDIDKTSDTWNLTN